MDAHCHRRCHPQKRRRKDKLNQSENRLFAGFLPALFTPDAAADVQQQFGVAQDLKPATDFAERERNSTCHKMQRVRHVQLHIALRPMNQYPHFSKKSGFLNGLLAAHFKLFKCCYENYKNNCSSDRCFKHRNLDINRRTFGNSSNWRSATSGGGRACASARGGGVNSSRYLRLGWC